MADPVNINAMLKHGIVVMIVGLVSGFGLTFSILGQISLSPIPFVIAYELPGTTEAWARMHTGCLMNGLMLVLFAMAMPRFTLNTHLVQKLSLGFILVAWSNVLFYFFGAFSTNRGLALSETPAGAANWASFIAYIPAVIAAVLLILVLFKLLFSLPGRNEL